MVRAGGFTAFGGARVIDPAIPPQGRRLMDEFRAAMPPARPIDDLIAGTLVGDDPALAGALTADKEKDVAYMKWAVRLCQPGATIVVDNVVRFGGVLDPDAATGDPGARGSRALLEYLSGADGVDATAVQTVGAKGWDGFLLAVVAGS